MNSRFLMSLQVAVVGAQKIGAVPHGTRVTALIASGHFEGPRLRGKVLPVAVIGPPPGGRCARARLAPHPRDRRRRPHPHDVVGLRHGPPEVIAALARGESVDPSTYYFGLRPASTPGTRSTRS